MHTLTHALATVVLAAYGTEAAEPGVPGSIEGEVVVYVNTSNASRGLPLLGFGTELVWQSTNDTGLLANAAAAAASAISRYPGGTPANYWDWSCALGNNTCCTEESLVKGQIGKCQGALHQATTSIQDWAQFVSPANSSTVFDLNVVQTNASYQLEGLKNFKAAGVPVEFIELGNELFDTYQGGWPTGAEYREAMQDYLDTISATFPQASFGLVGHEFHGGRSAVLWNQQVFNNSGHAKDANAATIHIYTIVPSSGITNSTVSWMGPKFLSSAWQFPEAQHNFLEATIPQQYRLWITEMGHRARDQWATPETDGTWLEGLYTAAATALTLQTARVDMILPYCLVCGLDNAPSFTTGPPWYDAVPPSLVNHVTWQLTPKGVTVSDLMHQVNSRITKNYTMRQLVFSPDVPMRPSLPGTSMFIGWAFVSPLGDTDGIYLLHLGPNVTTIDLTDVFGTSGHDGDIQLSIRYPPNGTTSLLQNMSSVTRKVVPFPANNVVEVPAWSVTTVDKVKLR